MSVKKTLSIFVLAVTAVVQLACNALSNTATPNAFSTLNALYTASALTLTATITPGLPLPTATGFASPVNTLSAGSPVPASRCDAAQFVKDVTYADGSVVARTNSFVKIWRVQNIGACSWTTSYALTFVGGDLMGGPVFVALPKNVNPGETVDIQATFTAPKKDGAYRGYWKLTNASGVLFGVGDAADTPFWVDIQVMGPSYIAYEFATNYCSANWENASGALPCPGAQGDPNGYVLKVNAPVMENGDVEDEPGLLISPQDKTNGVVSGQYPSFTVQAGDRFRALLSCQHKARNCNAVFRLDYISAGKVRTLGSWQELYEGLSYPIDMDLGNLAGKTVKFILVVSANGENQQDDVVWLNPHIIRQGAPTPTPKPTFTFTPTLVPTLIPTLVPTLVPTVATPEPSPIPTDEPTIEPTPETPAP